ncbi:MAG: hypothetical protein BMS9Abin36_1663 [Gammaproteobacteria bacterium]|nr:MAG: hypothetical protein BMS9Abin36_1663 [Gammaproteobacteria bacterium]
MKCVSTLLFLLLIGIMRSLPAEAVTTLQASIGAEQILLGEPVSLQVHYPALTPSLADLSLDALRNNFLVQDVVVETRRHDQNGAGEQVLLAALYPLRAGRLVIPALTLQGSSTIPLLVAVQARSNDDELAITTGIELRRPWVRQSVHVYLDVQDAGSIVRAEPGMPFGNAIHARSLGSRERVEKRQGRNVTIRRYSWAVTPLRAGTLRLEFPFIKIQTLRREGRVLLQYPPQSLMLNAKPLPAYIPVHIPVGAVNLEANMPEGDMWLGQTYNWQLRISGSGISKEGIKDLLKTQRVNNQHFRFYPPVYQWSKPAPDHSLLQTLIVEIPFTPIESGTLSLPTVTIPYVSADDGRLRTVSVQSRLEVSRLWVHRALQGIVGLVALAFMVFVFRWLWRRIDQWRAHRLLLSNIKQAADAHAIKTALLDYAQAVLGWRPLTLTAWADVTAANEKEKEAVALLQQACYASYKQEPDVSTIKNRLLDMTGAGPAL